MDLEAEVAQGREDHTGFLCIVVHDHHPAVQDRQRGQHHRQKLADALDVVAVHDVARPRLAQGLDCLCLGFGRQDEDGHGGCIRGVAHRGAELGAGAIGQLVGNANEVEPPPCNLLQRFGHAGRLGKFGASLAQQRGQHGATRPRGLDDQGAASGLCHGSPENAPLARHRSSLRENSQARLPVIGRRAPGLRPPAALGRARSAVAARRQPTARGPLAGIRRAQANVVLRCAAKPGRRGKRVSRSADARGFSIRG